jgi:hypothetical protein
MGSHAKAQPAPDFRSYAAEATESLVNVVPFRKPAPRHVKLKLVAPVNGGRSWIDPIGPLSVDAHGGVNSGFGRRDTISDFTHAGRGAPVKVIPESVTYGDEMHLTLMDLILTTLLFLSTLTGPALVWLLLQTAS